MKQGVLPFQYQQENGSPGMTALSGLMTYLELIHVSGLKSSVDHVAWGCGEAVRVGRTAR